MALIENPGRSNGDNAGNPSYNLTALMKNWAASHPDRIWLSERRDETQRQWTWRAAANEALAIGSWLQARLPGGGQRVALLSRNRAHWILADMAIMASGNITAPIFTTHASETARYILEFTEADVLFVGESENWELVRAMVPDHVTVVSLPGAPNVAADHEWDDLLAAHWGSAPDHVGDSDDIVTIVFTSGTTGVPKGVMHSHRSLTAPLVRSIEPLGLTPYPRFISYLPLAHLAEREQILTMSLILCGSINFLERRETLLRDLRETQPTFFFGAPRIWEQLQQATVQSFGGHDAYEVEMQQNRAKAAARSRAFLGFEKIESALSGSAPISKALLEFYDGLGLTLLDGFGQTEAMGLMCTTRDARRLGSVGKPVPGVEARISAEGELLVRGEGFSPGYFRDPEKTAETFVDGWVRTGDRARVDEDGFYFITGRVKDYFKTIHGKYVAPAPIEQAFGKDVCVDQLCLLGRGYSKTVMVCTPSPFAAKLSNDDLIATLSARVRDVNETVEKHARIGAVIVAKHEWNVENGFLTATLKVKRDKIEEVFGARARELAQRAAERKEILVESIK